MAEDDIQFVEPQYGAKDQKSFPGIILEHLERILKNTAVEWHGGYRQKKGTKLGLIEDIYVQNSREVFHNAVRGLYSTILCYYTDKNIERVQLIIQEIYKLEGVKGKIKKEAYDDRKIELTWKLYEELCRFLKELNYFKPKTILDTLENG